MEEPKPLKLDQHLLALDSHISQPLSITLLKYRDLRWGMCARVGEVLGAEREAALKNGNVASYGSSSREIH